jgi:hypothetical protein
MRVPVDAAEVTDATRDGTEDVDVRDAVGRGAVVGPEELVVGETGVAGPKVVLSVISCISAEAGLKVASRVGFKEVGAWTAVALPGVEDVKRRIAANAAASLGVAGRLTGTGVVVCGAADVGVDDRDGALVTADNGCVPGPDVADSTGGPG